MDLQAERAEIYARWRADFEGYARSALQVMSKDDAIVPFRLNPMQRALHVALEAMRAEIAARIALRRGGRNIRGMRSSSGRR